MAKTKMVFISCILFFLCQASFPASAEVRQLNLQGEKLNDVFTSDILPYMGAITFAVPEDANSVKPYVKGLTGSSSNSLVSGYNHNFSGNKLEEGHKPGVVTNVAKRKIKKKNVKIEGSPRALKGKQDFVDASLLARLLKAQADSGYYYTKDKTLSGSIGSASDYKIVVVDGAKLTLNKNFKGYGILIITGKSDNNTRLVMKDQAKWYGLIISDVGADYKESTGAVIIIGNKKSSGGIRPFAGAFERAKEKIAFLLMNTAWAKKGRGKGRPIIGPLPPIGGGPSPIGGNKAEIFGALIIAGAKPQVRVGYANIYYSKQAIDKVNEKFSNLKFIWKDWQEKGE